MGFDKRLRAYVEFVFIMAQEERLIGFMGEDVTENMLIVASHSSWYGDMAMAVAKSGMEGEDLNGIRKFMIRTNAARNHIDSLDYRIDVKLLERDLKFLCAVNILRKNEDGRYHWAVRARMFFKHFEEEWNKTISHSE